MKIKTYLALARVTERFDGCEVALRRLRSQHRRWAQGAV